MNITTFLFILAIYYAIHSLLAANATKQLLYSFISERFYRIYFNLVSVILLIPLVWMYFEINHEPLFVKTNLSNMLGWGILGIGLISNYMSIRQYNLSEFSGVAYLSDSIVEPPKKLNSSGLNKWVRHPLYTTTLLVMIGVVLLQANTAMLGITMVTFIYVLIGIQLEERKLIKEFGAEYLQYKKEVRMLIPFLF